MSVAVFLRFFLQQSPPPWPSSFLPGVWLLAGTTPLSFLIFFPFSLSLNLLEALYHVIDRGGVCVANVVFQCFHLKCIHCWHWKIILFYILHCCQFLQYWLLLLDCWCAEVSFGRRVLPLSHTAHVSRLLDSSYVVLDVLWQWSWKGSNGTLIFTPDNLFQVKSLQQEELMVEEECWWDWKTRKLDVKSRNLSATSWVTLSENSSYAPYTQNTNW